MMSSHYYSRTAHTITLRHRNTIVYHETPRPVSYGYSSYSDFFFLPARPSGELIGII